MLEKDLERIICQLTFSIDYFNQMVFGWEPLVEPWTIEKLSLKWRLQCLVSELVSCMITLVNLPIFSSLFFTWHKSHADLCTTAEALPIEVVVNKRIAGRGFPPVLQKVSLWSSTLPFEEWHRSEHDFFDGGRRNPKSSSRATKSECEVVFSYIERIVQFRVSNEKIGFERPAEFIQTIDYENRWVGRTFAGWCRHRRHVLSDGKNHREFEQNLRMPRITFDR